MKILRHYQIDIIFYFLLVLLLTWGGFYIIGKSGLDPHDYEWYIAGPLLVAYALWLWRVRGLINLSERRRLTGRTFFYWILLGVVMFASYATPLPASEYWSLNLLYLLFTILLADSYWDFRKLTLKHIFSEKDKA